MVRRRRGRAREERGAAAVEFALVLPIMILLIIGTVDFGVVFAQQLALSNAARQGARYAVTDLNDCSEITTEARAGAGTIGMDPGSVTIGIGGGCPRPCAGSAPGQNITVTASYPSELLIPMPIPGFPNTVNLQGSGTFRCEFS